MSPLVLSDTAPSHGIRIDLGALLITLPDGARVIPEIGVGVSLCILASGVGKENFVKHILFRIGDARKVQTQGDHEDEEGKQDLQPER